MKNETPEEYNDLMYKHDRFAAIFIFSIAFIGFLGFIFANCAALPTKTDDGGYEVRLNKQASELFKRIAGHDAITIGKVSFFAKDPSDRLKCHEAQHRAQAKAAGGVKKFWPLYLKETLSKGYKGNRYEIAASRVCAKLAGE